MSELIGNREERIRVLKEVITHLHRGHSPEEVRSRLAALVRETDYSEIAAMEQELIAEGMPVDEVRSMCDLHSQVVGGILREPPKPELPQGHPLDTFRRENEALLEALRGARLCWAQFRLELSDEEAAALIRKCREQHRRILEVENHYLRKENLLFPLLERHGVTGPSQVMWAKHDEVRGLLRALDEALGEEATAAEWRLVAEAAAGPALDATGEMIRKEEQILFPLASDLLTPEEWEEIRRGSPRFGWCLIPPPADAADGALPGEAAPARSNPAPGTEEALPQTPAGAIPGAVRFTTGSLSTSQLEAIMTSLPVDLTFVDADDRVAFFSEGPDRVFARDTAIIGRRVQFCHPPASVDRVERILSDFRAGLRDVAEFWIPFQGRFIHIRYFAVRDPEGAYLGTLEVTQDLTRLRALSGEKRLLDDVPAERHGGTPA